MKLSKVENPKVAVKALNLTQLKSQIETLNSAVIVDGKIINGYQIEEKNTLSFGVQKIYNVFGELYLYATDGKIYKKSGSDYKQIIGVYLDAPPKIIGVIYNGKKRHVAISGDKCFFLDDNKEFLNIYEGKEYAQVKNHLYALTENGVTVADVNRYFNFQREDLCYHLGLIKGGNTLNLLAREDKLLVFKEYSIVTIENAFNDGEFSVKEIYSSKDKIIKNSIKRVGEEIYFLNDKNEFQLLAGEQVKTAEKLNFEKVDVNGVYSFNGSIFYHGKFDNKSGIYFYDTQNQCGYFINAQNCIFADGGYIVNVQENAVYEFTKKECFAVTKKIYLGNNSHLERIKYISSGTSSVKIEGRFGSKKIYAGRGGIDIKTNLYSNAFTLTFILHERGEIENIQIEYS